MAYNNFIMICSLMVVLGGAEASEIVVGKTYPIAERSVIEEIRTRASRVDVKELMRGRDPATWSAFASQALPEAKEYKRFEVDMTYTSPFDVPDQYGNVVYPKGYKFNPLEYIKFPFTLGVIHDDPAHIAWARERDSLDMMWMVADGDPIKVGKALGRHVFILEAKLLERIPFGAAPALARQTGTVMTVEEIPIAGDGGGMTR